MVNKSITPCCKRSLMVCKVVGSGAGTLVMIKSMLEKVLFDDYSFGGKKQST